MRRCQKILIGVSLLIALGIRLQVAIENKTTVLRGDATSYDEMGMNLALGKGYRYAGGELTASRTPLYPLFLAAIYRVAGHNYPAVRIVQAILSAATVLLIALWAHTLFGGWSACFAALIASVYPAFYAYYFGCTELTTETLYVFLLTATLYSFFVYWSRPSWFRGVISGLFWGLANLTRPLSLPFLFLLPFLLMILRYPLRQTLRYCATIWFMVGAVMAPWLIRNYLAFHHFVPFSTAASVNLYGAFHPENRDGIGLDAFYKFYMPEEERLHSLGMPEAERANYFFRKGMGFIRDHPEHSLWLFGRRILLYMDPRTTLYAGGGKRQIVTWGYLFVLFGTVAAFILSLGHKKYRREILFLCLIFGYFLIVHAVMSASERYRFPTEPILIVLTSFALDFLTKHWKATFETSRR